MSKFILKDNYLEDLFSGKDPFVVAKEIEGIVYREQANRFTKEFNFKGQLYFIKYHNGVGWKEILKSFLQLKLPVISAEQEWKALRKLQTLGVSCPEPVAFASQGKNPARINSFIITRSLKETFSLEDFFFKSISKLVLSPVKKRRLIEDVAHICRVIHSNGINHRDLYLCHFHIPKDLDISRKKITLIDLHRAQIRNVVPDRWKIKDIGGLLHSAIGINITERDCYRFLKIYLNLSLREIMIKHKDFVVSSRKRAYSMYLDPLIKEIDLRNREPISKDSKYIKSNVVNKRWIIKKEYFDKTFKRILDNPDIFMSEGKVIKKEEGHFIVSLDLERFTIIIKKYQIKNIWHFVRKIFSDTRANRAWLAAHWFNVIGINTITHIAVIERYNFFSTLDSYLITKKQSGIRLDNLESNKEFLLLIANKITAFFKKLKWIGFNHGDAKSSNFFFHDRKLFAFDLDISRRRLLRKLNLYSINKDIQRMIKSFEKNERLTSLLLKRLK